MFYTIIVIKSKYTSSFSTVVFFLRCLDKVKKSIALFVGIYNKATNRKKHLRKIEFRVLLKNLCNFNSFLNKIVDIVIIIIKLIIPRIYIKRENIKFKVNFNKYDSNVFFYVWPYCTVQQTYDIRNILDIHGFVF